MISKVNDCFLTEIFQSILESNISLANVLTFVYLWVTIYFIQQQSISCHINESVVSHLWYCGDERSFWESLFIKFPGYYLVSY